MTSKKVLIILFIFITLLPVYKIQAQSSNAGFIPGNIWYSSDPFEEGDKIKIYTLIFNPDARELSGTVVFFDNSVFLGKKDFAAPAKGIKDVSIDWTATIGIHSIFGKIENAKFLISKDKYEEVYLAENETIKSSRTVNKKITTKPVETKASPDSILPSLESIKNIEKTIENKIPESVAKPVILVANTIEGLRSRIGAVSKDKKDAIQNDIKALNNTKTSSATGSKLIKPFEYAELFFFAFLSFIFNNKFIFYSLSFVILFLAIRYIWNLIF